MTHDYKICNKARSTNTDEIILLSQYNNLTKYQQLTYTKLALLYNTVGKIKMFWLMDEMLKSVSISLVVFKNVNTCLMVDWRYRWQICVWIKMSELMTENPTQTKYLNHLDEILIFLKTSILFVKSVIIKST